MPNKILTVIKKELTNDFKIYNYYGDDVIIINMHGEGYEPVYFVLDGLFKLNPNDWGDGDDFNPTFHALMKGDSEFERTLQDKFKEEITTIKEYKTPEVLEFMEKHVSSSNIENNARGIRDMMKQLHNFMRVIYIKNEFRPFTLLSDVNEYLKDDDTDWDLSDSRNVAQVVSDLSNNPRIDFKTFESHFQAKREITERTQKTFKFLADRYSLAEQKVLYLSFFLNFIENPFLED